MTCANHPDRERQAFCQNCGKPLCRECARVVGQAVFCEPCLEARLASAGTPLPHTPPPIPGFGAGPTTVDGSYESVPSGGTAYQYTGTVEGIPFAVRGARPPASTPNPVLAGLLGFIPGVGAMYNGQYAKGIVHLVVFAILVSLSDRNGIFSFFVAGWIFYQAFEAYDTARARRNGTPLPNPFGLNDIGERFGFGRSWAAGVPPSPQTQSQPNPVNPAPPPRQAPAHQPSPQNAQSAALSPLPLAQTRSSEWSVPPPPPPGYASVPNDETPPVPPYQYAPSPVAPSPSPALPIGAVFLILLGILFLVGDSGWFVGLPLLLILPILLIGLGIWIFVRRMTSGGHALSDDGTSAYRLRLLSAVRTSIWTTLTGVLFLLDQLRVISWGRSWPLYIIAAGVVAFLQRSVAADLRRRAAEDVLSSPPSTGSSQPPPAPERNR